MADTTNRERSLLEQHCCSVNIDSLNSMQAPKITQKGKYKIYQFGNQTHDIWTAGGLDCSLSVAWIKNHVSSFELGFLNSFLGHNLLRNLSLVLFLLQRYKYSTKNVQKSMSDSTPQMIQLWPIRKQENNRKTFEAASEETTTRPRGQG